MKTNHQSISLAFALLCLSACNTIEGAGKDIEAGGEVIADTAEEVKEEIKDEK